MEKIKSFGEFKCSLNESAIDVDEIRAKINTIKPADTGDNGATDDAFKAAVPNAKEVKVKGSGSGWTVDFKVDGKYYRAELFANGKLKSMVYGAYDENELVEEGWKEVLVAGALSLMAMKARSQDIASANRPKEKVEYSKSSEKKTDEATVDFGKEFLSGRYKLDDASSKEIEAKLLQIAEFVKAHQNNNISIEIEAGESQVPNRDVDGGKVNGEYKRMPKGALAQNRANTVKEVVETFMKTLTEKGVTKGEWKITVLDPVIGTTPWKPGDDPKSDTFTAEQFVDVYLSVTGEVSKPVEKYAIYSVLSERIFSSNQHALGDIFVTSRQTSDIRDQGAQDVAHQNFLFKTLNRMGKYDGREFLIPWQWWNKERHTTTTELNDVDWEYVQKHFRVK